MKTLRFPLLGLMMATLVFGAHAAEIRNGNFGNSLKGWSLFVNGVYQEPAQALALATFDDQGMQLRVVDIPGEKTKPASVYLLQKVNGLAEGTRYVLSFSVKLPAGEKALVGLGIPAQSGVNRGNLAGGLSLSELAGTGGWVPVELSFTWNPLAEVTNTNETAEPPSLQFRLGLVSEVGLKDITLVEE